MLQAPPRARAAYQDVEELTYMPSIWVKTEGFFLLSCLQ